MAEQSAKVTVTGTAKNPVFNIDIPTGAKGERGLQGERGVVGPTPQIKLGEVNTVANPSDQEWIAGMIRKSSVVTAALSETFPSTMKGDKGEPGGLVMSSLGAADLNTIVTPGVYRQNSGANSTPANNYPRNNDAGTMIVTLWGGTNEVVQEYTPYPINGVAVGKWLRGYRGSTWTPWRFVPTQTVSTDASGFKTVSTYDGVSNTEIALAGPGGWTTPTSVWSTTDANTLTTPGVYYQTSGSTLALNWPVALKGYMFITGAPGSAHQEFTPWTGMSTTTAKARFVRDQLTATTWSPWIVFSAQRVDNTAGRAIYTWDETTNREQLIYGDSGWRDVTALLGTTWSATKVLLRRDSTQVTLHFDGIKSTTETGNATFFVLPPGFTPDLTSGVGNLRYGVATELTGINARVMSPEPNANGMRFLSYTTGQTLHGSATFFTRDAWPTTLPGTAVGTIPNF